MDCCIKYLNTDLELASTGDLTELAAALEAGGARPLYGVTRGDDGLYHATIETEQTYAEPEPNIAAMLGIVESLTTPLRMVWDHCHHRAFNIGYDCGAEPWAFNQALSSNLLGRMAGAGVSLRLTLYPDRE